MIWRQPNLKNCKMINRIVLIIIIFVAIASPKTVKAQVSLTLEEQDYIKERNIIKAVSLHGGAPIQYVDAQGQVKGISKEVLELISNMTGLIFEYQLYDTVEEVYYSGGDIVFGIPHTYVPENMVL